MSDAGSNLPTLTAVLSPEVIDAILEKELTPLKARASVLTASCMRFSTSASCETSMRSAQTFARSAGSKLSSAEAIDCSL